MSSSTPVSKQPYLVRAYYSWLCDSGLTPYCLLDTQYEGVIVPQRYVQHNQILLNLNPAVCGAIDMQGDLIKCSLRFEKVPYAVQIPMQAIKALYAKENGLGIGFGEDGSTFELGDHADLIAASKERASSSSAKSEETTEAELEAKAKRSGITFLK